MFKLRPRRLSGKLSASQDPPSEGVLLDIDGLERHGRAVAMQTGAIADTSRIDIVERLRGNARLLESTYVAVTEALREGRAITPAAEWIVDNFHVITEQVSDIPLRLTPKLWRKLPAADHRNASGWPRIFHIAEEYFRHTLWDFTPETLTRFLAGYQSSVQLTMRELWALYPILRIALIDELRRVAVRVEDSLEERAAADELADNLTRESAAGGQPGNVELLIRTAIAHPPYVVQLAHRFQAMGERGRRLLDQLARELARRGTTIDEFIQRQHARRSASNLAARNIITSLRTLTAFDWRSLFEKSSQVELLLRSEASYIACDRRTRDRYRGSIEQLAIATRTDELGVTRAALRLLADVQRADKLTSDSDISSVLIAHRRLELEAALGYPLTWSHRLKRWTVDRAQPLYLAGVAVLTALLASLALHFSGWPADLGPVGVFSLALLAAFPASEVAIGFLNRQWIRAFPPRHLPRLGLEQGLAADMNTLVVMPVLLRTPRDALDAARDLQVHALANPDPRIRFALLSDWADATQETVAGDAQILEAAVATIARLNAEHVADSPRFFLFHRRRQWNAREGCFMGWERKRGKLTELNQLLLGRGSSSFVATNGDAVAFPRDIRYVMTLDADTRVPLGAVKDLVGIAAHPLNQPVFSLAERRVVQGYAVLQPRVTPILPGIDERSLYREIITSGSGIDPYAAAVSDLNQDIFREGLFTGKGLYDLAAWSDALSHRIPENSLLSHDLFEGLFARCALVADVEFFEEFPSHSEVAAARTHRWIRGDWQLLPWILGLRGALPPLGRWKMLDNLRRSLLPPISVALLIFAFATPALHPIVWFALVLSPWLWPAVATAFGRIVTGPHAQSMRVHFKHLVTDFFEDLGRALVSLALLAQNAWLSFDAISRALFRLTITRRHLLEWVTAAQLKAGRGDSLSSFVWPLKSASIVVVVASAVILLLNPDAFPLAAPLLTLWWLSPVLAQFLSRPRQGDSAASEFLPGATELELRGVARLTWRFFERFVNADDNHLPPDNFQEDPVPVIAHRTSPTNFGLYLLAAGSARDFGWLGVCDAATRFSATLDTMSRLERFNGHYLNWYDTRTLAPLLPRYVSTVDSGNVAGHLLTLGQFIAEMQAGPLLSQRALSGPLDAISHCRLLAGGDDAAAVRTGLDEIEAHLRQPVATLTDARAVLAAVAAQVEALASSAAAPAPASTQQASLHDWLAALSSDVNSHLRDLQLLVPATCDLPVTATLADLSRSLQDTNGQSCLDHCRELDARLTQLRTLCATIVREMSFGFLFDKTRGLFTIGYRVADHALDAGYYDLLASEARLASLVAIAKGDAPRSHWFRLGRRLTGGSRRPVLASWSGSMFEYLMPALVMREPRDSLLDQTNTRVVQRQIAYGAEKGLPWGISESAYNIRDRDYTYQYCGFGLPSLGLKRGLGADYVVAPYATALAAMYDPTQASRNLLVLAGWSGAGEYGFYEALDFTASRLPEGKSTAVVRAYMAHHQGMSLVALNNALHDRRMQGRFHAEPMIAAAELLLQERGIRFVEAPALVEADVPAVHEQDHLVDLERTVIGHESPTPVTQVLSNRNYSVMLTDSGAGYSVCRSRAVTRWREDATQDCWGSFIYLRDLGTGDVWSAGFQPTAVVPDDYRVQFNEDSVAISRRDGSIGTKMEVIVVPEDDGELRRVTFQNDSSRARQIEVTSFAEIVLAPARADIAHPGFSNLFVQTEFVHATGALLATRRPRSSTEPHIWAAHVLATASEGVGHLEYETDRMRFFGRGRSARSPLAMQGGRPLSNTVGNVLDPVFSLRSRVTVPAGGTATLTFATFIAASREQALLLAVKYRNASMFEHAAESAWTFARAELYYLQSGLSEARLFQALASHLLFATRQLRAGDDVTSTNSLDVTHLWRFAVSGDRPILLISCSSVDDQPFMQQCLRAQEYLRIKRVFVDVVILNERKHSYIQDLQESIERTVRAFALQAAEGEEKGGIFALRADAMTDAERVLLLSMARVVLTPAQGSLAEQLQRPLATLAAEPAPDKAAPEAQVSAEASSQQPSGSGTEFFNGLGGFIDDGREYAISLTPGRDTPAPWSNVLANEDFGTLVTESGAMCTWSLNSRENQLTPWSNDPVSDPSGEAFYVKDEEDHLWSPTAQPIRRAAARYEIHHGQGYSRFNADIRGIATELLVFVAKDDPVKLCRLRLTNRSARRRRLTVISYVEWALGATRAGNAQNIVSRIDTETGAMFASNPALIDFGKRVAFCDLGGRQQYCTGSRHEFLGRNGSLAAPSGAWQSEQWTTPAGAGLDPCCAFSVTFDLEAQASEELLFTIGQAADVAGARTLVETYRQIDVEQAFAQVRERWNDLLGAVTIRTPDRALDLMFNRWLLYQTISCRIWARAAFYQAGGAFGFRDQLQDGMALAFAAPQKVRAHLLRAAARQFVEGDVQHWWHPPSGRGVRTHFSDDRIWLPFATFQYLETTQDFAVLDESVPFIEGPPLPIEKEDSHYTPALSATSGSLFEHCARALDVSLRVGVHDLPLMGGGDWNDGMNRVGHEGRGESVWLAWFLITTLRQFAPIARARGETQRARTWSEHVNKLTRACEQHAWDGAWYRRAFFDDGTPLGSAANAECRIDSLAQSWAVLSAAADTSRAQQAMNAVEQNLVKAEDGVVLLFTPPFDVTPMDPGYIKGYIPGLRENGGQYTHAAIWVLMAQAVLKDATQVGNLLEILNPVRRSESRMGAQAYRVEPYVLAADVYHGGAHSRRGGWTWYTGAAGWFYRAILEYVLGIRVRGEAFSVAPCMPAEWPQFEVDLRIAGAQYLVRVRRVGPGEQPGTLIDGTAHTAAGIPLLRDGAQHIVEITVH